MGDSRVQLDRRQLAKLAVTADADPLLRGAIDLHCHSYADVGFNVRMRFLDAETLEIARKAGMRGIVFKSHLWPTTGQVALLRQQVSGIDVFGSITLDVSAGGLSPWAVEAAADQEAKVVWMPTWSAANSQTRGGFGIQMSVWYPSLQEHGIGGGLSAVDSSGKLLPAVRAIIGVAKERGLVLSTGHLSASEALAIAEEAQRIGFDRLVFGHPLSGSVGATLEEIKEMAKRGAYIELTALNAFFPSLKLNETAQVIQEVGADRCILSTDRSSDWPPPASEFLRMFIGRLLLLGVTEESIQIMVQRNPAQLLGLPVDTGQASQNRMSS